MLGLRREAWTQAWTLARAGGPEAQSGLICSSCGERISLFPTVSPARAIWQMEVDKLGEIPFSGALGEAAEGGVPLAISAPDSPTTHSFMKIANELVNRLV